MLEDGQFANGVHANVAFVSNRLIAEDPFVISEDFAKRVTFNIYENKDILVKPQDIMRNLYGDIDTYKAIPDVGEKLREDGIICAIMRLDKDNELKGYHNSAHIYALMEPDVVNDKVYHTKYTNRGEVVNIEVIKGLNRKSHTKCFDQLVSIPLNRVWFVTDKLKDKDGKIDFVSIPLNRVWFVTCSKGHIQ